jgi:hypothetical protein
MQQTVSLKTKEMSKVFGLIQTSAILAKGIVCHENQIPLHPFSNFGLC